MWQIGPFEIRVRKTIVQGPPQRPMLYVYMDLPCIHSGHAISLPLINSLYRRSIKQHVEPAEFEDERQGDERADRQAAGSAAGVSPEELEQGN